MTTKTSTKIRKHFESEIERATTIKSPHGDKEGNKMASRARQMGICDYRMWTTEELIEGYAFEAGRINREDAEQTKKLIKQELQRRFKATISLLDDPQTIETPAGTLRYLLGE